MSQAVDLFEAGYNPEYAARAAAACRTAAEECRTVSVHVGSAADQALAGWTGTARDGFIRVCNENLAAMRHLIRDLEALAAAIEAATAAAGRELERLVQEAAAIEAAAIRERNRLLVERATVEQRRQLMGTGGPA